MLEIALAVDLLQVIGPDVTIEDLFVASRIRLAKLLHHVVIADEAHRNICAAPQLPDAAVFQSRCFLLTGDLSCGELIEDTILPLRGQLQTGNVSSQLIGLKHGVYHGLVILDKAHQIAVVDQAIAVIHRETNHCVSPPFCAWHRHICWDMD